MARPRSAQSATQSGVFQFGAGSSLGSPSAGRASRHAAPQPNALDDVPTRSSDIVHFGACGWWSSSSRGARRGVLVRAWDHADLQVVDDEVNPVENLVSVIGRAEAGVDEFMLPPTVPDPARVDLLAEAAL